MSEAKLNQIESMVAGLIQSVGTLKAYFEEEREENSRRHRETQRRFEQIDQKFEQIDQRFEQVDRRLEQHDRRFDEVMEELRELRGDVQYMGGRIFENERDIKKLKNASYPR